MSLTDFQKWVRMMWSTQEKEFDLRDHYIMGLGLAGETGEVLDILKKHVRDKKPLDTKHLEEELGDVLYYLAMICNANGLLLDDVIATNVKKLEIRYKERIKK